MIEPTPAKRPTVVALLWTYCGVVILLGLIALVGGIVMIVFADLFDLDESEDYYVGGGIVAFVSIAVMVIHAVPLFLKRDDTAWRIIYGFLITYLVIWGLFCTPFLLFPVLLMVGWIRPNVKAYYGVKPEVERDHGQRQRMNWDDGWDEQWDRPRP